MKFYPVSKYGDVANYLFISERSFNFLKIVFVIQMY